MPSKIFKDLVFCFAGNFPGKSHPELTQMVEDHGATVSKGVSQRVTHLIALEEDVKRTPLPNKLEKAVEGEIPIVGIEFIEDSIAKGRLLEEEKYSLRPDDYKNDDPSDDDSFEEEKDSDDNKKAPKSEQTEPTSKKRKATDSSKKASRPKKPKKAKLDLPKPDEFLRRTGDIPITIKSPSGESVSLNAQPKKFRTGTLGWSFAGQKMKLNVGEQELMTNITGNFVIRGVEAKSEEDETEKKSEVETPVNGNNNNNNNVSNANPTDMNITTATTAAENATIQAAPTVQFNPVPASGGWKCIIM